MLPDSLALLLLASNASTIIKYGLAKNRPARIKGKHLVPHLQKLLTQHFVKQDAGMQTLCEAWGR